MTLFDQLDSKAEQEISFTIYGEPVAQGRPRAGRDHNGNIRMYDPQKSRDFKQYVKLAAAEHRQISY